MPVGQFLYYLTLLAVPSTSTSGARRIRGLGGIPTINQVSVQYSYNIHLIRGLPVKDTAHLLPHRLWILAHLLDRQVTQH